MKALVYLLITQLKNRILSLKKKPAMLVLYCFVLALIIFSIVMICISDKEKSTMQFADERILFLIIAGLGLFFLYAFTTSGLSTGASLFTMPDIGLLFVSPISSKIILMYGLITTLGKALLGSIFIFYQIGTLKTSFGYGFTEIFALFIILALMILFCQLMSIGIYIFSNGNSSRKNLVKSILYAAIIAILLITLLVQKQNQVGTLEAILSVVNSKWFGYIPVAGWSTMFFIGVVNKSVISILIPCALYLVMGILIVSLLTVGKADYYEDVLVSTEFTYQNRLAAKEGRNISRKINRKIKVKKDNPGIGNGKGAMTFLYKHLLEMRRRSRFIFIDSYSMFIIVGLGIAGYQLRIKDASDKAYYIALALVIYFQYFATMMGKLKDELIKPYIYLIPENSMKKVFAASLTSLLKPCVDAVCMFAVFTVLSGLNPLSGVFFALAYAASGAVFVGMTVLYQRLLGGQPNIVVQIFIGIGILFLVMVPSIGASVAAAVLLPKKLEFLCTLPYSLFCLLFTLFIFIVCRNLIDKTEYTGKF
ncbi:MAG: putative ABC exporter domain-containing protein [Herbinix sp.]|nr:putative ABC exporter domain-containing protein [Herbinix sp.]